MANTSPVNDSPAITRYMLERAGKAHCARLVPVSAVTQGLRGIEPVDFAAMVDAGARLFSDDGIPIDDAAVLSRALDETMRLGYAVALHEEDRALSCGGALNVGAVAEQSGRQRLCAFGGAATRAARSRDSDRLGRGGSCRPRIDRRVTRTHPRRAPTWRASHLRGDAASFHLGRKRRADLGAERENEPAASQSRRCRSAPRGDSRRHR